MTHDTRPTTSASTTRKRLWFDSLMRAINFRSKSWYVTFA
jgi:hypothetical protein